MHEMGLMENLLAAAARVLGTGGRAKRLSVAVGPLAGVDERALRFAFAALTESEARFAGAELAVRKKPIRMHCPPCRADYEATLSSYACPACGQVGEWVEEDDIVLEGIEVENV